MPARVNNIRLPADRLVVALPRKAACTTMKRLLQRALNSKGATHERYDESWQEVGIEDTPDDYELIGVLRDPVTRMWSGWRQASRQDERARGAFEAYLRRIGPLPDVERDVHVASQLSYTQTPAGRLPTSWIYVEHLARDWAALCARKGWPVGGAIPHENARNDFRVDQVTPEVLRLIETHWREDCELYQSQWTRREAVLARIRRE